MGLFDVWKMPDIGQGVKEFQAAPGAILLDVRSRQEFQEGHIPGSQNVPLSSIEEADTLAEDKETPLFVYCYSGARSGQATQMLRRMGYTNVKNIGGIAAWTGEVER
ncbi:MAG: rhodanese-like domain-containing protein [Oscillospiraceae bacterium]|jgi:phage shock protein E|nr:rhodanese-like domain-containing protein [Oscillospiraceae bacterium]